MSKEMKKFYNFASSNNTAELYILSTIGTDEWYDETSMASFKADLDLVEGQDLTIHISSGGGSVFEGNGIANLIKKRKGATKCVISSLCASIATQIALACDEVSMYKNGLFMIHRASCGIYGNSEEIKKQIALLETIDDVLATTYADKTGMTKEKCLEYMDAETWFTSNECLDLGFIDSIVEDELKLTAKVDTEVFNRYKNTPKELLEAKVEEPIVEPIVDTTEQDKKIKLMNMELDLALM